MRTLLLLMLFAFLVLVSLHLKDNAEPIRPSPYVVAAARSFLLWNDAARQYVAALTPSQITELINSSDTQRYVLTQEDLAPYLPTSYSVPLTNNQSAWQASLLFYPDSTQYDAFGNKQALLVVSSNHAQNDKIALEVMRTVHWPASIGLVCRENDCDAVKYLGMGRKIQLSQETYSDLKDGTLIAVCVFTCL